MYMATYLILGEECIADSGEQHHAHQDRDNCFVRHNADWDLTTRDQNIQEVGEGNRVLRRRESLVVASDKSALTEEDNICVTCAVSKDR